MTAPGTSLPPPPPSASARPSAAPSGIGQGALAMAGLGTALVALRAVDVHAPACPFRTITGVACPGCGITRLSAAVAGGDLHLAVGNDPAGVAFLALLTTVAVVHLVQVVIRKQRPPSWLEHRAVLAGLGALLAAHWVTTLTWGGMLTT